MIRLTKPAVALTGLCFLLSCGARPKYTVSLSWSEHNNADKATSFEIFRDGESIGHTNTFLYTDNSAPHGDHSYYVEAVDKDGNDSAPSNTITLYVP